MEFGLFADRDTTRFCYLRLRTLEKLVREPRVADEIMFRLEVPGSRAQLKRLTLPEKHALIQSQIAHYRRTPTSIWYEVDQSEVLAAAIWDSDLPDSIRLDAFAAVGVEAELLDPISRWLAGRQLEAFTEVPLGTNRVDALGYRRAGLLSSEQAVSVELKNDIEQLKRGIDQLGTFAQYSTSIYLACTPALAAEYLARHSEAPNVKRWDALFLAHKLKLIGAGLLLVEGDDVYCVTTPTERDVDPRRAVEMRDAIRNRKPHVPPPVRGS
ncbi:MAG: hypothetical protein QM831_12570 [Kofleriaceae bacterium]